MAGTVTVTYKKGSIKRADVSWTSDASGDATGTVQLDGEILKVVTNPTDGPSANYDITIVDEDGVDIAQGLLANRHTTNSEEQYLYEQITLGGTGTDRYAAPIVHYGACTFTVANAGNAKSGVARIFYR